MKTRLATLTFAALAFLSTVTGVAGAAPAAAPSAEAQAECTKIGQAPNTVERFSLFAGTYYNGSCITFYGYGACTASRADRDGGPYDLRSYGWSDRADSVWTYNKCDVMLYDSWNCPSKGSKTWWIDRTEDLGTWKKEASCLVMS